MRVGLKVWLGIFILVVLLWMLYPTNEYVFPPTLVINLEEKTQRWKEVSSEFSDWTVPIERFLAIKRKPGSEGCALSHIQCLKVAKQRNYPWVLIIEDDCMLTPNALHHFHTILPFLWNHREHWDFYSGGTTFLKQYSLINYDLKMYQVKGYATQCMLAHKGTYDKVIDLFSRQETIPLIDVFYETNFRVWTSLPYLSRQRPAFSDITEKEENYNESFEKAERILYTDLVNTSP